MTKTKRTSVSKPSAIPPAKFFKAGTNTDYRIVPSTDISQFITGRNAEGKPIGEIKEIYPIDSAVRKSETMLQELICKLQISLPVHWLIIEKERMSMKITKANELALALSTFKEDLGSIVDMLNNSIELEELAGLRNDH